MTATTALAEALGVSAEDLRHLLVMRGLVIVPAAPALDVALLALVEAWDALNGKVKFRGTSPDSVDLGLAFDAAMAQARALLDGEGEGS